LASACDAIEVFLEAMAEDGQEPIGDCFIANVEVVAAPA
jgi:hypothetical protein